jgi:hypothetical protein
MDADRSRLFLLSIISVPAACGPGVPGGVAPDAPLPTDDQDDALEPSNGEGGATRSWDGCEAFFGSYLACYSQEVPPGYDTGYDSGYASGDEGGSGVPNIAAYCEYYLGYLEQAYGSRCAEAIDDAYACTAPFACQDLFPDQEQQPCAGAWARADSVCPSAPPDDPNTTG